MKEKLKNKKIIAGLCVGCVAIVCIIIFVFMNMNNSVLQLKTKEVAVEYGQKISLEAKDYLKETVESKIVESTKATMKGDIVIDDKKGYLEVGEYTVILSYEKDTVEVEVIVKDTIAPTFKDYKDMVETAKDVIPDYSKLYVAEDLSKVTISCEDKNVKYDTLGEYKATIKAIDESKNEVSKEIVVKVVDSSIKLDKDTSSLYIKETLVLKPTIIGKEQKATFKSNNDKVATVDNDGKVTAKAVGTATITATANGKDTTCKVTVKTAPKNSTTETKKDNNGNTVTVIKPNNPNNSGNSSKPTQSSAKISMEAFNLINNERAKLGLNKLKYASDLESIALARAKELTIDFSHNGMDKYDPNYRLGEVCTKLGSNNNATHAVNNWMNSKAHRNILMDPDISYLIVSYCGNCWEGITK